MTMYEFNSQPPLVFAVEVTAIIMAALLLGVTIYRHPALVTRPGAVIGRLLQSRLSRGLLVAGRIGLTIFGIIALVLTAAPVFLSGLTPLDKYAEAGMGVMLLFFLWPILMAQSILGWRPWEQKLGDDNLAKWALLLVAWVVLGGIDRAALTITYG